MFHIHVRRVQFACGLSVWQLDKFVNVVRLTRNPENTKAGCDVLQHLLMQEDLFLVPSAQERTNCMEGWDIDRGFVPKMAGAESRKN